MSRESRERLFMQKALDVASSSKCGEQKKRSAFAPCFALAQSENFWVKRTYGVHPDDTWRLTPHDRRLYNVKHEKEKHIHHIETFDIDLSISLHQANIPGMLAAWGDLKIFALRHSFTLTEDQFSG